jgi:hypothetical protein
MIGGYSGGEQRLLMIAASLGADQEVPVTISLEDELPGLDREYAQLVLAAIAHAAGFHHPGARSSSSTTSRASSTSTRCTRGRALRRTPMPDFESSSFDPVLWISATSTTTWCSSRR